MKQVLIISLTFFLSYSTFGQNNEVAFGLHYKKVTEFEFDNKLEKYNKTNEFNVSGALSVDKSKIFIQGYNGNPDKTFVIVSKEKEEKTGRDMYVCTMDNIKYVVALSPDKKYLTQIGLNDKYIYEISTNEDVLPESHIIKLNKSESKSDSEPTFIYAGVDTNPLFLTAKNDSENEKLINQYILEQAQKLQFNKKGKAYVQFVIDNEGEIIKTKVIYGKEDEFNKFAHNVVSSMPKWKPGEKEGKTVKVQHTIEVKIE